MDSTEVVYLPRNRVPTTLRLPGDMPDQTERNPIMSDTQIENPKENAAKEAGGDRRISLSSFVALFVAVIFAACFGSFTTICVLALLKVGISMNSDGAAWIFLTVSVVAILVLALGAAIEGATKPPKR